MCSPCPRSAQYFLHNKSALTSHCTTVHLPALSYKTTVHKSAPTPLHALRSLRKHPPLSPYISIFFSTSIHFHTVQIKYFLHFSTFLAFLRSCILPAIHALTPHICYPHYRFPARILFLHSRVVPLCCTHALYALYRTTETYHLGDTILHIPRWFPSTIPDLPMSSCISSTSNGITLLILSDTTLVILFLAFLHSCVLAPTRFVRTVFLHVLMNFYGILTFPFFFPHSPFCGATQAHLYCTCAAKHQHMQYHKAVRPALPGINAADDRRNPCFFHVCPTYSTRFLCPLPGAIPVR